MTQDVWLGFYGGEPLLSWPLVEKTVAYALKKFKNKFRFTLTTNGSLLNKEHILFFKKHHFDLVLSYDGLAQQSRDAGSVAAVEAALENLRRIYPAGYVVNSVFTPRTAPLLAVSMEKMLERGHSPLAVCHRTSASPGKKKTWRSWKRSSSRLAAMAKKHRQKTGRMPLENFAVDGTQGHFRLLGRPRPAGAAS